MNYRKGQWVMFWDGRYDACITAQVQEIFPESFSVQLEGRVIPAEFVTDQLGVHNG